MSEGLTHQEQQVLIFVLREDIARLKQAMVDNCPTSMVQCGCGLHYKQAGEKVCKVCKIKQLGNYIKLHAGDCESLKTEVDMFRERCEETEAELKENKRVAHIGCEHEEALLREKWKLEDQLATSQTEANDLRVRVEGLLLEIEELSNG